MLSDFYEILQVHPNAEPDVIRAAYRRLMAKYHPDQNKEPGAEKRAKRINEAFATLKDPERRAAYDTARATETTTTARESPWEPSYAARPPQASGWPPPPAYGPSPVTPTTANTSGMGGAVPDGIKGWNWGAFWLSWIWGIGNNVWMSLLVFCLGWIWASVLGIKGSEWAWQHRQFDSIEQFKETQAVWAKWGWVLFGISSAICILFVIATVIETYQ